MSAITVMAILSSRSGRKPQFSTEDRRPRGVRVSVSLDEELIKTLEQIRVDIGEPSFSGLVRRLLKERLGELGMLKEDARKALGLTRGRSSEDI
jgi:hypothetical protein